MAVLLATVFVASLLGSLHCVGMCGPFAMLASASDEKRKSAVVPAVAYSSGRLTTYLIVGILFGAFGYAINQSTEAAGFSFASVQQTASYFAGGLMIVIGVIALARQLGVRVRLPSFAGPLQRILQNNFQRVTRQPPLKKAFLIGALSCLMPCGWLYTFAIVAAGTASPWSGAAVMVSFWAGTVPIMFALMLGFGKIGRSVQKRLPLAMASIVILIGVFTLAVRAPVAIGREDISIDTSGDLTQQVKSIDQSQLPCCDED